MAAGGLSGIFGAFLYPKFRRRLGIERTGLFGFFLEVSFLCLCVASVWAPGSPFDPLFRNQMQESVPYRNDTLHIDITTFTNLTQTNVTTFPHDKSESSTSVTNISVWLLMAGIVGARCGKYLTNCVYFNFWDTLTPYNTVELQWLDHLWDHGKVFEPWVVRAIEG